MNLKTTTELVKKILEEDPFARSSDDFLYVEVCRTIVQNITPKSFGYVMTHRKELGLPPFESVRRSRQKIQAQHPELAACDKVEAFRLMEEQKYREFAKL